MLDPRDPTAIGNWLIEESAKTGQTFREVYDSRAGSWIFPTEPSASMVDETIRKYRTELEVRAATGDRYAISMLTTGEPGDEPE